MSDLPRIPNGPGISIAYVSLQQLDAFAPRIVVWQIPNSLRSDLALDAMEQRRSEVFRWETRERAQFITRTASFDHLSSR